MADKKEKRIEDYRIDKPPELEIFELKPLEKGKLSNSIHFYDGIPRYVRRSPVLKDGKYADPVERIFVIEKNHYKVTLFPAQIEKKDGTFTHKFPGEREELVEEVLRKIICEGSGFFLDDEVGGVFTLYQIQQELKSFNHTFSITEIKEALEICANSSIKVSRIDNHEDEYSLFFSILQTLALTKKRGINETKAFVRFNPLVTKSILKKTHRLYNYRIAMNMKDYLARYIYKRLCHNYTQASKTRFFDILLTTLLQDSGMKNTGNLSHLCRRVEKALNLLKKNNILSSYEKSSKKEGKKIIDWKFKFIPHDDFIKFMKYANHRNSEIKITNINIVDHLQAIRKQFR